MPIPTSDELFGGPQQPLPGSPPPSGLPSAQELYGPAYQPPAPPPPQTGAANDAWWTAPLNMLGRIVQQTGYGLAEPFDGRPMGLSNEDEESLRKSGILPDYTAGNVNFLNSAAAAIILPATSTADLLWNTPAALAGGIAGFYHQAAEEIQGPEAVTPVGQMRQALATPVGMLGDIASGVTKGYYGELPGLESEGAITTYAARNMRAADASAARATGTIGEGEAGYYDAHPLTPEASAARTAAADDAGIAAPEPLPPPPDIHSLARRIDPETFDQYDALNAEAALHRARLAALAEERTAAPEAVEAQGQIDTILGRVNNVPSRLTNAARGRLEAAQARLDAFMSTDTPEMAEARAKVLDADFAMRDLAVDVSAAYRHAREIAPDLAETAPVAEARGTPEAEEAGKPEQGALVLRPEDEALITAAAGARPQAEAEAAPASVTGPETLGGERLAKAEEGAELARTQAREAQGLAPAPEAAAGTVTTPEAVSEAPAAVTRAEAARPDSLVQREMPHGEPGGISAEAFRQAAADVEEQRSARPPRANILQEIRKLGGMKVRDAEGNSLPGPDVNSALEDFKHKPPGVINNASGMSPEYMHDALRQRGWFGVGDVSDEALVDAIAKQARGEDVYHPESGLAEAHARRGMLDRETVAAGVERGDSHATATLKLAEWRQMQKEMAERMDDLRARADALGVKHAPDTTYDELLVDVVEREAIQGEIGADGYDAYERDIESGLTRADIEELDRIAADQLGPEHGEGPRAFDLPEGREPAAGAGEDGGEPAAGAGGGGHGTAGSAGTIVPVRGTGETVARGLAAHTEADAIEAGLTQGFGDLPEYERLSLKDQAAKVFEFVSRDYEAAKRVAMGLEAPPAGILPESVYVGVEKRALREGDVDTIRQLATGSRLSTEATTMGQRIRTLGERDRTSPVGALQAIQRAREAAFNARRGASLEAAKAATVEDIRNEVREAASPPDALAAFMKSLEC